MMTPTTIDEFIAWLATQCGRFELDIAGSIRETTTQRCPLQVLTGKDVGYHFEAVRVIGYLVTSDIMRSADDLPYADKHLRRRMLDALGLKENP